jgi:DNA-binding CsgD family transcriptional regulator
MVNRRYAMMRIPGARDDSVPGHQSPPPTAGSVPEVLEGAMRLDATDVRRVLEVSWAAASVPPGRDPVAAVLPLLLAALDADAVAVSEVPAHGDATSIGPAHHAWHGLAMAVPIGPELALRLVFHRSCRGWARHDVELAEVLRAVLACARRGEAAASDHDDQPCPPLTRRQAEVLRLVAGGATDKEVALALGISPRTVQKHLEHVYARLGVHRRTGAALLMRSSPGDRGHDAHDLAVGHRRGQAVEEADVLLGDEHVDEAADLAVAVEDALGDAGMGALEAREHLGQRPRVEGDLGGAAGQGAELGRDADGDGHGARFLRERGRQAAGAGTGWRGRGGDGPAGG